ncbi:MAG: Fic family protein [Oscillospiraceae bacterium]|jgi:Fic family protein|nr:Fic family protein [Oscillospiraceae bacterium]
MDHDSLNRKREYYKAHKHLLPPDVTRNYEAAFLVEYTHNSTAIEGNTLSLIETKLLLEDKLSIGGKELREIYEVTNHAKAFDFIKRRVAEGSPLDENTVKDIHQILMENIFPGGIYRDANVRISGAGFRPPSPNEMYVQVKNFFADLPFKSDMPPIELAAWVHAEFVRIHPFKDGNGRTARMIMNYRLMLSGWLPVSVPKEDRLRYYETLEEYAVNGDIEPFAAFVSELENQELDNVIEMLEQTRRRGQIRKPDCRQTPD